VLRLPAVADKTFLITIGDRTVGGLVSRDQLVGPWQVPVSDVAVTAADYEGVAGEALAAGRPVVNTLLSSGVPFVSVDGLTGFSVAPGDSEALAVSLNRLLGNSALRWKFGQEGIRRVKREFTIDKMVGRTIDLYRKVLAPARPAGLPVQAGQFPAESGIAFAGRMAAAARES
jgi:hypothetical protein